MSEFKYVSVYLSFIYVTLLNTTLLQGARLQQAHPGAAPGRPRGELPDVRPAQRPDPHHEGELRDRVRGGHSRHPALRVCARENDQGVQCAGGFTSNQ